MRITRFLLTTSLVCFALAGAPAAFAQTPATGPDADDAAQKAGLDVVIITAQKREENLQETPISASVLSADGLENRNVVSLVDLGDGSIPSLKVAPFFSRPGALIMNIRGVGVLSDSNQPARDQGVGVYIDGVYLGRPQGLGAALYDIQNIEVLKGPQGTLFGRNTEGGAVNIVTKKPSGEFAINASGEVGNFGAYKTELHVDLPTVANISFKVDGVVAEREGFVHNKLADASDFGGYTKRGIHIEGLWKPIDGFNADYAYDNSYDATSTLYQQLIAPGSLKEAAAATLQTSRTKEANVGVPQQPSVGNTSGHRLTLEWDPFDSLTLKSISSYRDLSQSQYDNGSASSTMITTPTSSFTGFQFSRYSLARFKQSQYSQEFQAIGDLDHLKYVVGALYYHESVRDNAQAFATNQFTDAAGSAYTLTSAYINGLANNFANVPIDRASRVTTTSAGVFGQATWTPSFLDERLHATVGGRWTKDEKVGQLFEVNNDTPVVNGVKAPLDLNKSWNRFDPLVNVGFDVTDDIFVYGKWSTGYKSGGANSRSLFYAPFNPETVSMFELGAKTEFWDHRLRVNLAAYVGTYKDVQLDFSAQYQQFDPVTGALITTLRTTTETSNAPGDADLSGFEADVQLAPIDGLTLSASYAYNKVDIPDTLNPFRQSNGQLITVPIPIYQVYTPENSGSVAADYEAPVWNGKFVAHLDANFDDGFYSGYTDVAYDPVTRAVTVPQPKGESGFVVNGRLALADIETGRGTYTIALWARNLLDEEHLFVKSTSVTAGTSGFFNDPRTFGIEIKVRS